MSDDSRAGLRAVFPDLTPWRSSRDFRRLWWSGLVSVFGSGLTLVALPVQIKELTGSALAVGAIGAVELVPLVVFGLYGGALADASDRRSLIVRTELALGVLSALLLGNDLLPHPMLWPLYAVAALASAIGGLQRPALDAILPRLVPAEQFTAAAALNSVRWQLGEIAAPALAGLLIALAGTGWAYGLDAASFGASVLLCAGLAASPASHGAARPSLRGIAEGARYAWGRKELLGTYAIDMAAMFFAYPVAVFPFLADALHARWALGLMYAALPAGALVSSVLSGWTGRVRRHGRAVVFAAGTWGLAMAAAGRADRVWPVVACLAVAGGADEVSGIFRQVIWTRSVPDELRGRLAGIEMLSFSSGPQLGQARSGAVAAWAGARAAVWSGGLACAAAVALLAGTLPTLWRYDDPGTRTPDGPGDSGSGTADDRLPAPGTPTPA